MSWLDKIVPSMGRIQRKDRRASVPDGLWRKCPKCEAVLYLPELEKHHSVCPKCEHHLRLTARKRLDWFLDKQGREEIAAEIEPNDRLKFRDSKKYKDRLTAAQKRLARKTRWWRCAASWMACRSLLWRLSSPLWVVLWALWWVKFVRAATIALEEGIPLVCFAASGGARMQEALFSLMQMAKTSAALKLKRAGVPYISVLTDPVFGGVSASLAMLGDLNIAEPNALIGFAGPRVIEQTVRETLPEGFQRSEFLLEHGTVDMIVHRHDMRARVGGVLRKLTHQSANPAEGDLPEADVVEPVANEEQLAEAAETSAQADSRHATSDDASRNA